MIKLSMKLCESVIISVLLVSCKEHVSTLKNELIF